MSSFTSETIMVDECLTANVGSNMVKCWPLRGAGVYNVRIIRSSSFTAHCEGSIKVLTANDDVVWEKRHFRSDKAGVDEMFSVNVAQLCTISITLQAHHFTSRIAKKGSSMVRVRIAHIGSLLPVGPTSPTAAASHEAFLVPTAIDDYESCEESPNSDSPARESPDMAPCFGNHRATSVTTPGNTAVLPVTEGSIATGDRQMDRGFTFSPVGVPGPPSRTEDGRPTPIAAVPIYIAGDSPAGVSDDRLPCVLSGEDDMRPAPVGAVPIYIADTEEDLALLDCTVLAHDASPEALVDAVDRSADDCAIVYSWTDSTNASFGVPFISSTMLENTSAAGSGMLENTQAGASIDESRVASMDAGRLGGTVPGLPYSGASSLDDSSSALEAKLDLKLQMLEDQALLTPSVTDVGLDATTDVASSSRLASTDSEAQTPVLSDRQASPAGSEGAVARRCCCCWFGGGGSEVARPEVSR